MKHNKVRDAHYSMEQRVLARIRACASFGFRWGYPLTTVKMHDAIHRLKDRGLIRYVTWSERSSRGALRGEGWEEVTEQPAKKGESRGRKK